MPTESQIRAAIVALVRSADPSLIVHDHFRTVKGGMGQDDFDVFHTNDEKLINVCFVRRVSFADESTSFDDFVAANETYALFFYRGAVDSPDGLDSENAFQAMLEAVREAFRQNKHLGLLNEASQPENGVSQAGMGTFEGLVNTTELGGYHCHKFVGRLVVTIGEC